MSEKMIFLHFRVLIRKLISALIHQRGEGIKAGSCLIFSPFSVQAAMNWQHDLVLGAFWLTVLLRRQCHVVFCSVLVHPLYIFILLLCHRLLSQTSVLKLTSSRISTPVTSMEEINFSIHAGSLPLAVVNQRLYGCKSMQHMRWLSGPGAKGSALFRYKSNPPTTLLACDILNQYTGYFKFRCYCIRDLFFTGRIWLPLYGVIL